MKSTRNSCGRLSYMTNRNQSPKIDYANKSIGTENAIRNKRLSLKILTIMDNQMAKPIKLDFKHPLIDIKPNIKRLERHHLPPIQPRSLVGHKTLVSEIEQDLISRMCSQGVIVNIHKFQQ